MMDRDLMVQSIADVPQWDVCIIGGGATGLGTALQSAAGGLKTILLEQDDFAKGTSSRSTKLIHGGVRYLQQGNIKLVKEALVERGLLLQNAPHLVHNLRFVIPSYHWWERPFYWIGLKLYDRLAGKLGLGDSAMLSKAQTIEYLPTISSKGLRGGILYHDGQFDDARLAISIAQTAANHGATLLNHFPVTSLVKTEGRLTGVTATDALSGLPVQINSKVVVNATGVFTDAILRMNHPKHRSIIRPSQGVHLVVDQKFLPRESAILVPRTDDGRVLFAVPWHNRVILGTTDTSVETVSLEPKPMDQEIDLILRNLGKYLLHVPQRSDVKSVFAGLRPLVKGTAKKTAALSRGHVIIKSKSGLFTVTGGKWTTYRKMAEDVVKRISKKGRLNHKLADTRSLALHGHDLPVLPFHIEGMTDDELTLRIRQAVESEMCMTVEDFLSRRTRQLLLDARVAIEKAPRVAELMAEMLGKDQSWIDLQIRSFQEVAKQHIPDFKLNS